MPLNRQLPQQLRKSVAGFANHFAKIIAKQTHAEKTLIAQGIFSARQLRTIEKVNTLADVEFSIFSQWGEDGIIEWLIQNLPSLPESFVEFGVENYVESNTRFLLLNRNWTGLVIDGGEENIKFIRRDPIFWRHDLSAVCSFITRENINDLIASAGLEGDIGILSIDIDGMDYWVWQAIEQVKPSILIIEYNAVYGNIHPIVTPYDPAFLRTKAHPSNLYYGASIQAIIRLGREKGFTLIGSNRAGNNAFFLRNDLAGDLLTRISNCAPRCSRFREARDADGRLTFVRGTNRSEAIANSFVHHVDTGSTGALASFKPLYDNDWL